MKTLERCFTLQEIDELIDHIDPCDHDLQKAALARRTQLQTEMSEGFRAEDGSLLIGAV